MSILSFDKYALYARVLPGLIVILPIGFGIISLFPQKFLGWDILVGLGTSFGMSVFIAELARDKGKQKQSELYQSWGGEPTTLMLRHNGSTLDSISLRRYHEKLGSMVPGIRMPSVEDERSDPGAADEVYQSCVAFLREHTREKQKFPLVFAELVSYGFRRNLWGMKAIGITSSLISFFIVLWQMYPVFLELENVRPTVPVVMSLDVIFLILWIFRIKPEWVKTTADAYALQLISSCERL
jgi:hypothetical protein